MVPALFQPFPSPGSLGALLAQLDFLAAKNGFWHASLSLEQLLHQLLPSTAGPRCPQSSALPQAQRAQQPRVLQKRSLDEFMCSRRSRRTSGHFMTTQPADDRCHHSKSCFNLMPHYSAVTADYCILAIRMYNT